MMSENGSKPNVVLLCYPAPGHSNPTMELAKRLASKSLHVTFVTSGTFRQEPMSNIQFETIDDGLPLDFDRSKEIEMVLDQMHKVGSISFQHLVKRLEAQAQRVCCIVYDSFLTWAPQAAKKFDIPSAFFWTQSCAVFSIYYHYINGLVKSEEGTEVIKIPGLPNLRLTDLPTFIHPSNPFQTLLRLVREQFSSVSEATWVLGNSFDVLESREIQSMVSMAPIRTVGPLLPSAFLEQNNPGDPNLGKGADSIDWLNTKAESSVVYVSFGSLAVLSKEQIEEIALGLKASGHCFLWVIRHTENNDNTGEMFPEGFLDETAERGLILPWSPQMRVLSHPSVGAFMTHCGWNSTLESLNAGLPLLAVPQWSDQVTNSKYVEEVWKTGIRLSKRTELGREEVEKSVRMIMEDEAGVDLRKNALRWKAVAREAMAKGGSSDRNIQDFVDAIAKTSSMSSAEVV